MFFSCMQCFTCFLLGFTLFSIICFIPGIPPDVKFSSFSIDKSMPLTGPLAPNSKLDSAERLYEGYLIGPESIASRNGPDNEIFVSVSNGDIVRIWGQDHEHHKVVANLGPGCARLYEDRVCSRPLGMRFGPSGLLYIAESSNGIHTLNVDNGNVKLIIPSTLEIGGRRSKLVNDLDMDGDIVYWSDASSEVGVEDEIVALISEPSGRLIRSNLKTGHHEVLLPNLHFANGVQLSPAKDFVLVSEAFRYKVMRYWLKGPKRGQSEIFISGLPGIPDNIRSRVQGGFLIGLMNLRDANQTDLYELLSKWPTVCQLMAKFTRIIRAAADYTDGLFPNYISKMASFQISSWPCTSFWIDNNRSMIVEVDENGKIIGSYQGHTGQVKLISQALEVGEYMYIGSPFRHYLGRLKLKKGGEDGENISEPNLRERIVKEEL